MRDHDFNARDEQGEESYDGDPVGYADERGVPLGDLHLGEEVTDTRGG